VSQRKLNKRDRSIANAIASTNIASLQTAAVTTGALGTTTVTALGADTITAISATASSAVVTADASAPSGGYVQAEAASTATLANALKVQSNINALENADLRARQAQNKTAIDDLVARGAQMKTAIDNLTTTVALLRTNLNAIQAAIDAL
jgi:hypothetical protein